MVKEKTTTLPHIRYADVNVFVEEAKNIENHRPAIVVVWEKGKKPLMRIIPSNKWDGEMARIEEILSGLFSHETLHIWLGRVFGEQATIKLDWLPKPQSWEEFMTGVFGWNLRQKEVETLK